MGLTGNIITPYPAAATDTSWKAAKTAAIRDKWNTELGAALRAAQVAYNKIKFEQLDLAYYEAQHNTRHRMIVDVEMARTAAQQHYNVTVKPALKVLADAKSKADWAGRNLVITKAANTKAKQIAVELNRQIVQLKSFNLHDFDTRVADLRRNYQFAFDNFAAGMTRVLHDADQFILAVRAKPTVKVYNAGIEKAARDITQMIGQVDRLKKHGLDLHKDEHQATVLFDDMSPRADGHDFLPATAKRADVLLEAADFERQVNAVKVWWR